MKDLTPITPGEVLLEEFLAPLELSQNQLASFLGVDANRINQIVNNKREITADTAIRLSHFFCTTPQFWLNLQSSYNLKLAREVFAKANIEIPNVKNIIKE